MSKHSLVFSNKLYDPEQEVHFVETVSQVVHGLLHTEHFPLSKKKPAIHEVQLLLSPGLLQVEHEASHVTQVFDESSPYCPLGHSERQFVPDR